MSWDDFATQAKAAADWGAAYRKTIRDRPVRAQTTPGDIAAQLGQGPPEHGTDLATLMQDFDDIVMPGITHWQ
ncbi:MAG: aspartate aminotransferase family protein, partial [Pseudomonadota bacterium]